MSDIFKRKAISDDEQHERFMCMVWAIVRLTEKQKALMDRIATERQRVTNELARLEDYTPASGIERDMALTQKAQLETERDLLKRILGEEERA